MLTNDDQREIFERVLEAMDDCSRMLRLLDNPRIQAYCLADFEGREGGWMGRFVRDVIEDELKALDGDEEDEG